MTLLRPLLALCVAAPLLGCGASIRSAARDAPREAVPVVVDETLKAGEDAAVRERLVGIVETPEMRRAVAQLAAAFVAGGLDEASSHVTSERIASLVATLVAALTPVLDRAARDISRAAVRTVAEELPVSLGPAIRTSLSTELGSPELHGAVDGLVSDMTRTGVRSSRDAVRELDDERKASGKTSIIDRVQRMVALSWGLAFFFGALVIALIAFALRMRRRARRYRIAMLRLIARQRKGEERKEVSELMDALAH